LSDFHVGKDYYAQRKLFSQIHENVADRITRGFAPDFVFISGDIANKGASEEYVEFFDHFLTPLMSSLGDDGWNGKIFSIPGNHDVQRDRSKFFNPKEILQKPDHVFDPTDRGKEQRNQFISRFENYNSHELTNSPTKWLSAKDGSFSQVCTVQNETLGIIGINTAWLSQSDSDRHLLSPGPNILEDALNKATDAHYKIVLGHHPLHWLADSDAQQIKAILGKYRAIYLHGHLHKNDARQEDGGNGLFLSIQSGAAFQGRAEDSPQLISGIVWAELDTEKGSVLLQPQHWSTDHREWKISSDAFANDKKVEGTDWWQFVLPGRATPVPLSAPPPPAIVAKTDVQSAEVVSIRNGWAFVDRAFLATRKADDSPPENLLQFFDGRPPNWRLALSPHVPRRAVVDILFRRFDSIEDASKPTVVNLIGAGGEGKSTAFHQIIARMIAERDWVSLWRHIDTQSIDIETVERFAKQFPRVIIAIDEAHSAATWLPTLLIRMKRIERKNVHFLLCSRSIDWRSEAKEMGTITRDSDYQEITLRGLNQADSHQIVRAWEILGKEGLRNLYGMNVDAAADKLHNASISPEVDEQEGAFLGAMLRLRYGDSLKDKIRSIIYRLKDIPAPGGSLLEAYAMIAAMHNEGLRFLSLPVLAEALDCSYGDVQRKIINPLADEAIAAGGGRFVLCRHKAIAEATVQVLNETNLYGGIEESFSKLSRAAIIARKKGLYVPDLHKWDYNLPRHFGESGRYAISIAAAEGMQSADPTDIHLRVNLSKSYREAGEYLKATEVFRDFEGEIGTRIAWHEWAVAEREIGNHLPSLVFAAISICDIPASLPPGRGSAQKSLNTISRSFYSLYERYSDPIYLQAVLVATQLGRALGDTEDEPITSTMSLQELSLEKGGTLVPHGELISSLASLIQGVTSMVDFELLVRGRVPRASISSYEGLAGHLR
jgi:predicted MPP superfamily phosphohydrolase